MLKQFWKISRYATREWYNLAFLECSVKFWCLVSFWSPVVVRVSSRFKISEFPKLNSLTVFRILRRKKLRKPHLELGEIRPNYTELPSQRNSWTFLEQFGCSVGSNHRGHFASQFYFKYFQWSLLKIGPKLFYYYNLNSKLDRGILIRRIYCI